MSGHRNYSINVSGGGGIIIVMIICKPVLDYIYAY